VTRDLTPLPDLVQGAGLTGPARTRRPVYVDLLPPCNAACPAGEDIQAWLAAARDGDYERAWRLLTEDNPFPAIHGRVCYQPVRGRLQPRGPRQPRVSTRCRAVPGRLGDRASPVFHDNSKKWRSCDGQWHQQAHGEARPDRRRRAQRPLGRPPRARISLLRGRVRCSLAASTGVETAADVAAYLLAGADVVMTTSALLRHGPGYVAELLGGLRDWMRRKGFAAAGEVRGLLSAEAGRAVPGRAGYLSALDQATHTYGPANATLRICDDSTLAGARRAAHVLG
jgi:dihydroprymidine dehydrogenase-like protein